MCRDVFDSRKELESHEERHLLPGGFKCSSCQKVYQNEVDLQQHEQIAHNVNYCLAPAIQWIVELIPHFNFRNSSVFFARLHSSLAIKGVLPIIVRNHTRARMADMLIAWIVVQISSRNLICGKIERGLDSISH